MGFVASGANKRTYAHELGHGAFGLEHTFPEIGQSLSNNLMDYGDSTHLTHKQCKDIAKRKFVFNWLDSEEDGSLYGMVEYAEGNNNPSINGTAFTLSELKRVSLTKNLDWNVTSDRFKIADVFEYAFFEAANAKRPTILYNDTKDRQTLGTVAKYTTSVRIAKVSPDGIGPTGWKSASSPFGKMLFFKETAFYEVKSGGTTLDANYSISNPKQLLGMLDALRKQNIDATLYGTPTLFLITLDGTPINLSTEAALYGINLIQITPILLSNGEISFSNAKILYAAPKGPLSGLKFLVLPLFDTSVPLRWGGLTTAYDED